MTNDPLSRYTAFEAGKLDVAAVIQANDIWKEARVVE